MKIIIFLVAGILLQYYSFGQTVKPIEVMSNSLPAKSSTNNLLTYDNKKLPEGYEKEAMAALSHFPELQNVQIKFRVKKSFATLKTRPAFLSMLMPKSHRIYLITISNKTIKKLMPFTCESLPENAKVGIMGHELSHVVDFSKKTTWQSFRTAIGHLSKHYMDSLEYNTDKICIEHGLGKELETWSSYIRSTMKTTYWRGANFVNKGDTHFERYMNPGTIEKYMEDEKPLAQSTTTKVH